MLKIAFVLFDGVTFLDFVGFYDVIYNLNQFESSKGVTWDICGLTEEITDELGMKVKVQKIRPHLADYDMVFIPGGLGTRKLRFDETFVSWLREAQDVKYKVSVCTIVTLGSSRRPAGQKSNNASKSIRSVNGVL